MTEDPFSVLGLAHDATLTEVRDARRRLARTLHPDVQPAGEADPAAMQRVNAAFDACVAHVTGRRRVEQPAPQRRTSPTPGASAAAAADPAPAESARYRQVRGIEVDAPSFTIDALPAEAFEALLVVAATIGDVIDDDPPYVLECLLADPVSCWCRLELVPDAGSSTVSIAVGGLDGQAHPPAEDVRDVWVEELNRLGRPLP